MKAQAISSDALAIRFQERRNLQWIIKAAIPVSGMSPIIINKGAEVGTKVIIKAGILYPSENEKLIIYGSNS